MKNDVCIKAGSYCPICKGVVLADCRHDSSQFSVPMRYQRMEFNAQLQNEVKKLTIQRDELLAALEKLAKLGNEPHYGNSIGNQIARDALAKVGAGSTAEPDCDRSACGDFSPGRCDNPKCSALRPPTPIGWSDTDWLKHLQERQHPLAGLHINQGSMDAAADAYEAEFNARHNVELTGAEGVRVE